MLPAAMHGKGLVRAAILLLAGAVIAAVAAAFGIVHDYGYLHASILTGSPEGWYYSLASGVADRARHEHGSLVAVTTAGSVENVSRLAAGRGHCREMFALIQDGIPVPADARLELLGRVPEPETLLLLGRSDRAISTFSDLRGASIGIGPEGSGTAYLMRQLFQDPDLRELGVRLSQHQLPEQAALVARKQLDVAAFVMQEDAPLLRGVVRENDLDIVAPEDLRGLVARYPWLSLGTIAAGRYDLVRRIPAADKQVAQLATLVVANQCAQRADRIALLMLLAAQFPRFVHNNPPGATAAATVAPLAPEAVQFFRTGQPEVADRYFPWLVNLMSPVYWVYLVMAVTVLFNVLKGLSRFRLWRIDSAREKLETALKKIVDRGPTHAQMRSAPAESMVAAPEQRAVAHSILEQLTALRLRCQRQVASIVTPMGDEMFYRYQQALIDEAITTLAAILAPNAATGPTEIKN